MRETQVNGVIFGVPSTGNGISSPPHPAASTAVLAISIRRVSMTFILAVNPTFSKLRRAPYCIS